MHQILTCFNNDAGLRQTSRVWPTTTLDFRSCRTSISLSSSSNGVKNSSALKYCELTLPDTVILPPRGWPPRMVIGSLPVIMLALVHQFVQAIQLDRHAGVYLTNPDNG